MLSTCPTTLPSTHDFLTTIEVPVAVIFDIGAFFNSENEMVLKLFPEDRIAIEALAPVTLVNEIKSALNPDKKTDRRDNFLDIDLPDLACAMICLNLKVFIH
jgi:hypothetical protein